MKLARFARTQKMVTPFRFVPRVEDLERREAPSFLLSETLAAPQQAPAASQVQLVAPSRVQDEEAASQLFDLALSQAAEPYWVNAADWLDRAADNKTPDNALNQEPFSPGAERVLRSQPVQELPSHQGGSMYQVMPPGPMQGTVGNQVFVAPAASGSLDALWSSLNAGNTGNTGESGDSGPGITAGEFTESLYASGGNLSGITGLAWAPDHTNRLFVTRKAGDVMIIQDGVVLPTPFATIRPIFTASECGLIGIAFDPDYLINGYIYFFVTVANNEQQIIRYTDAGNVGVDKTTIIAGLPTRGANHDGGAVGFGIDGKLYWAIGDLGNFTGVNEDLTTLAAKIGRANRDGSVPGDNPFDDGAGPNNDYIWAIGHRNPFTFTFQPWTNQLWVNTVGTSYEQVFVVDAGTHAGYNRYENNQPDGFLKPVIKYRTNGTDTRTITANGAVRADGIATFTHNANNAQFRRGEKITISGVADASFNGAYFVLDATPNSFTVAQDAPDATSGGGSAVTLNIGGCLTGGAFYDATSFPSEYIGNYFFGDCNTGRVIRATLDDANNVTSVDYFRRPLNNSYIDAAVGPDGSLYYGYNGGQIYRLSYNQVQQHLVISPRNLVLDEGGYALSRISLAVQPETDVVVDISFGGGDEDIVGGAQLIFTPKDWATPQSVYFYATPDKDLGLDYAYFAVSAEGMDTDYIITTARDNG